MALSILYDHRLSRVSLAIAAPAVTSAQGEVTSRVPPSLRRRRPRLHLFSGVTSYLVSQLLQFVRSSPYLSEFATSA